MVLQRARANAGFAIGVVIMVVALIAVIVGAFRMGSDMFGTNATTVDRTVAELGTQIDLIRAKVEECVMINRQAAAPVFMYPNDSALGTATIVRNLDCPRNLAGQQNLWTGQRPASLPRPPAGFEEWVYVNHGDPASVNPGGTCIRIQPQTGRAADQNIRTGIRRALRNYASYEYTYDANSTNQQVIIWIRRPQTGTAC